MGEKGYCFKQGKVLSNSEVCKDFKLKVDKDIKKRLFIEDSAEGRSGPENDKTGVDKLQLEAKGLALGRGGKTKKRVFVDTERGEGTTPQAIGEDYDQDQRLFLVILVGGLIVLIVVMFASGVF
jgi:hypothetical protein